MQKYFRVFIVGLFCLLILSQISLAQTRFAADITRLGVGARPLGMGKMFTGLSDDISAMYLNPGGLAYIDDPEVLSMSGKFVNLVNYLTLATVFPSNIGTIGIGYCGAGLGFSSPVLRLVEVATGEYRVIPSTNEVLSYDYNSYVVSFPWAYQLRDDLGFGVALKFFNESLGGATAGTAFGYDVDLGLLFKPNDTVSLGLLGKNFLPEAMGGVLTWSNGAKEAIPSSVNAGGSLTLRNVGKLILGADYEFKPTQSYLPGYWHLGAEWWPIDTFAFRGGVDQDVIGSGTGTGFEVTNNPTAGISLLVGSFRFDYAYHKYNDLASNDTHYFSLVYKSPEFVPLYVIEPKDKLVTHEMTVIVRGEARDFRIKSIRINDRQISIEDGKFEAEVSLMLGKNTIWVAALDSADKVMERQSLRVLRLAQFTDVPPDHWAIEPIEYLGTLFIMPGYTDGTFQPDGTIKRADLLINLLNIDRIPPAADLEPFPFSDIETKDWVAPYAKAGFEEKLIIGYPDNTFRPWNMINRAEGTTMAVRYAGYNITSAQERPYDDISTRFWAINDINTAKENGLLWFIVKYFYPNDELSRAEQAAIMSQTPKVAANIFDLANFNTGYQKDYPY